MIDLHQGISGNELSPPQSPDLGTIVISELDAISTLLKGKWREAFVKQGSTLAMASRTATDFVKRRLGGKK